MDLVVVCRSLYLRYCSLYVRSLQAERVVLSRETGSLNGDLTRAIERKYRH